MNTSEAALNRAFDRVERWLSYWLDKMDFTAWAKDDATDW
jgi:hypothetical protein